MTPDCPQANAVLAVVRTPADTRLTTRLLPSITILILSTAFTATFALLVKPGGLFSPAGLTFPGPGWVNTLWPNLWWIVICLWVVLTAQAILNQLARRHNPFAIASDRTISLPRKNVVLDRESVLGGAVLRESNAHAGGERSVRNRLYLFVSAGDGPVDQTKVSPICVLQPHSSSGPRAFRRWLRTSAIPDMGTCDLIDSEQRHAPANRALLAWANEHPSLVRPTPSDATGPTPPHGSA